MTLLKPTSAKPIKEIARNTFVINLQQAIFGLETGSDLTESIPQPKHFLTGLEFTKEELQQLLQQAKAIKQNPQLFKQSLAQLCLVMVFEKPSFRTRLSFDLAIQSMGGYAIESISATRKAETPADMMRVLNGYADFVMIRTHDEGILDEMAAHAKIPIINGLSALHHPCQVLADLLSLEESYGSLQGLTLAFIGDGNNILHSLMLLAPQLGLTIHYCCPESKQPNAEIVKRAKELSPNAIVAFAKPEEAVKEVNAVYTDVWTSMGFEQEQQLEVFDGFQVNEQLMSLAHPHAVFMHCMPMVRGQEVSATLPDSPASIIFRQSENRLHVQKALLLFLALHPDEGGISHQVAPYQIREIPPSSG